MPISGKIPPRVAARLNVKYWVSKFILLLLFILFITISPTPNPTPSPSYLPLFVTFRFSGDCSPLFVLFILLAVPDYSNNRVFLWINYRLGTIRLIVATWKFDVLTTIVISVGQLSVR